MSLLDVILKEIPLYTNEKYFLIFINLLKNIKKINLLENLKIKRKLYENDILNPPNKKTYTQKKSLKPINYWSDIQKAMNKKEIYNGIELNNLELKYLIKKANFINNKLERLVIIYNENFANLYETYVKICKKTIDKNIIEKAFMTEQKTVMLNKIRINNYKHKKSLFNTNNKKNKIEIKISRDLKSFTRDKAIQKIKLFSDDIAEEEKRKKIKNIGTFLEEINLEKYFNKKIIPDIKECNFSKVVLTNDYNKILKNNYISESFIKDKIKLQKTKDLLNKSENKNLYDSKWKVNSQNTIHKNSHSKNSLTLNTQSNYFQTKFIKKSDIRKNKFLNKCTSTDLYNISNRKINNTIETRNIKKIVLVKNDKYNYNFRKRLIDKHDNSYSKNTNLLISFLNNNKKNKKILNYLRKNDLFYDSL